MDIQHALLGNRYRCDSMDTGFVCSCLIGAPFSHVKPYLHLLERLDLLGKPVLVGTCIVLCVTLRLMLVLSLLNLPPVHFLVRRLLSCELLLQLLPVQCNGCIFVCYSPYALGNLCVRKHEGVHNVAHTRTPTYERSDLCQ